MLVVTISPLVLIPVLSARDFLYPSSEGSTKTVRLSSGTTSKKGFDILLFYRVDSIAHNIAVNRTYPVLKYNAWSLNWKPTMTKIDPVTKLLSESMWPSESSYTAKPWHAPYHTQGSRCLLEGGPQRFIVAMAGWKLFVLVNCGTNK